MHALSRPNWPGRLSLLFVGIVLSCGCESKPLGGPGTIQYNGNAAEYHPAPTTVASLKPEQVKLEVVDGDGYQTALTKHKGNVILVDFWATWCEPCTEKFPHIVELHQKHEANGLRVISFSNDALSDAAAVRQFLADRGATFDNLQTKFGVSTETNDTFGIHGVPYYKLYDRKGELRYQFAEVYDDLEDGEPVEKIDERVAELLAESPS